LNITDQERLKAMTGVWEKRKLLDASDVKRLELTTDY
jgi:hypothetical protein